MFSHLFTLLRVPRQPMLTIGCSGLFGWQKVRVPLSTLNTHLYVAGKTGMGKSSFLLSLADQLVRTDQGIGLIDPHGDLVSDLLATLASYPQQHPWAFHSCQPPPYSISGSDSRPYCAVQSSCGGVRTTVRHRTILSSRPFDARGHRNWLLHLALLIWRFTHCWFSSTIISPCWNCRRLLTDKNYREQLLCHVSSRDVVAFFHTSL